MGHVPGFDPPDSEISKEKLQKLRSKLKVLPKSSSLFQKYKKRGDVTESRLTKKTLKRELEELAKKQEDLQKREAEIRGKLPSFNPPESMVTEEEVKRRDQSIQELKETLRQRRKRGSGPEDAPVTKKNKRSSTSTGGAQQGFIARRRADLAAQRERGRLAALEEEQRQSRIQAEKETSRQAEAGPSRINPGHPNDSDWDTVDSGSFNSHAVEQNQLWQGGGGANRGEDPEEKADDHKSSLAEEAASPQRPATKTDLAKNRTFWRE